MLRPDTLLRLVEISQRTERCEKVSIEEMIWAEKWSNHNRSAYSIIRTARRRALTGPTIRDSIDELLEGLDVSDPDPSSHIIGPQEPDSWASYFSTKPNENWLRRD